MDEEKLTDEEILDKVKKFREDLITSSFNFYDRMKKANDFQNGKQWDPAVKAANERKGKFCLTIPLVKPTIKQVVGNEIKQPKDIKVRPLRRGSTTVANILSALAKHARDSEHVRYESTMRFEAGVGNGMGVMGFFVDRKTDPRNPQLRIEKLNEFECGFDPNCMTYDPNAPRSGCQYVIWEPWEIKEEVEAEYPEKEAELKAIGSSRETGLVAGAVTALIEWMAGIDSQKGTTLSGLEREDIETLTKYRYQKNHTWWKEPKRCLLLYDNEGTDFDSRLIVKDKDIANVKKAIDSSSGRFSIEEVVRPVMHHTIRVGDVLLEDIVDELNGVTMFPLVPFYAYFKNGYKSGMAEDMIGCQEEINYAHSQTLNLIKNLANTGWRGKFSGKDVYKRWLEVHGGEDGVVLDLDKAGGFLEKIQPNTYPAGFDRFTEQAKENLKMITNVRTEDPSIDKDRVASAIALKQEAALTGQASIFANHDYTLAIEGNLLIEIIRNNNIYSEDEIREIVEAEDLIDKDLMEKARQIVIAQLEQNGIRMPEPATPPDMEILSKFEPEIQKASINGYQQLKDAEYRLQMFIDQAARPIAEAMVLQEIKDIKRGRYNTKVTMSPMAPTHRIARSAELFELNEALMKNGQLPIGRSFLIEATDVNNKEEIIAEGERQIAMMARQK